MKKRLFEHINDNQFRITKEAITMNQDFEQEFPDDYWQIRDLLFGIQTEMINDFGFEIVVEKYENNDPHYPYYYNLRKTDNKADIELQLFLVKTPKKSQHVQYDIRIGKIQRKYSPPNNFIGFKRRFGGLHYTPDKDLREKTKWVVNQINIAVEKALNDPKWQEWVSKVNVHNEDPSLNQ